MTVRGGDADGAPTSRTVPAERAVFFSDAVVAIAITLLIIPLLESVSTAGAAHLTARQWAGQHAGQIYSLLLSFVIIATFWTTHHGTYERVARLTPALIWLNMAWLLMIVWTPVATAMQGSGMPGDRTQIAMYIGPLFIAAVVGLLSCRLIRRTPPLWVVGQPGPAAGQEALGIAFSVLFGLVLILALVFTSVNYVFMVLLAMVPLMVRLVRPHVERQDQIRNVTR